MILISHRGNTEGKPKQRWYEMGEFPENHPAKVEWIMTQTNYEVEIDVWYVDGKWFLGHDKPEHQVWRTFLDRRKMWCHAKNIEALVRLRRMKCQSFWHGGDSYTLTSGGYIWTFPEEEIPSSDGILVLKGDEGLGMSPIDPRLVGICSDWISQYA